MTTTWRAELVRAMAAQDDRGPIVAVAPGEEVLDVQFDDGFGGSEGPAILAWTESRVYFPVVYNGSEWIDSAPRNPVATGQFHVGGQ